MCRVAFIDLSVSSSAARADTPAWEEEEEEKEVRVKGVEMAEAHVLFGG